MTAELLEEQSARLVAEAMEEAGGLDLHAIIERARAKHQAVARARDLDMQDFEAGTRLAVEMIRAEVNAEVRRFVQAFERKALAMVEGRNRHDRRAAKAHMRRSLDAGRAKLIGAFEAMCRETLKTVTAEFDAAEDDFARLMAEALED